MVGIQEEQINNKSQMAAYLSAVHQMDQSEISHQLELSQSQVSRLLNRAEEKGWLVISKVFDKTKVSEQRFEELRKLSEPVELTKKLKKILAKNRVTLRRVTVFDSGPQSVDFKWRLIKFGKLASHRLVELLKQSQITGVSWGATIGHVIVDGVDQLLLKDSNRVPVQVVPVCGELMGTAANEFTSTRLANRLNKKVSSFEGKQYFLSGVPAYIPLIYEGDKRKIINEYIQGCASYQKIFSIDDPLIDSVDTFITSVSSSERPLGAGDSEVACAADITIEHMRKLIIGDIGGALIPGKELSGAESEQVERLNDMWTGIKLSQVQRIAEKASNNFPGNIVIAIGRNKAQTILTCLSMGLINELIIDRDLANALNELLTIPE